MKKTLLVLAIIMACFQLKSLACSTTTPTISGPAVVELNTSGNQFTLVMDAAYKSSSGGYTNTEWSFQGIGIVGYGETLTLNTTSASWSNLPEGNYTLTAKNQFGGSSSCFGCISNTTFTKQIEFRRPRPDLRVISVSYFEENKGVIPYFKPFVTNVTIENIGNAPSSTTFAMEYKWVKKSDPTVFYSAQENETIVLPTLEPNQSYTIQLAFLGNAGNTPSPSSSEIWIFTCTINYNEAIKEKDYSNNSKSYERTISGPPTNILAKDIETNRSSLISISDASGNLLWKKGEQLFDFSQLKGLNILKFEENGVIHTQKIVHQ